MDEHVIVWDLETVPDLATVARIHGLPLTETALIREALGDKFPKHFFHSIVCIGALIARRSKPGRHGRCRSWAHRMSASAPRLS